jgi:hypothetical protein
MGTVCQTVCAQAAALQFLDPLTNLPPRDECSLSALLTVYHHQGQIAWERVPMLSSECNPLHGSAADIFKRPGCLCSEYPLFWDNDDECRARGGMRPDWLLLGTNREWAAIIESKLGAVDTHKNDEYGGQFGRYIKYLMESKVWERFMVLLTSSIYLRKNPPWYATELKIAVDIQKSSSLIRTALHGRTY